MVPIPKINGSVTEKEYRGINVLPFHEKYIEKILKDQLTDFLSTHNILMENQSGFRAKHSCESAMNLVIANWKQQLDEGKVIIAVFLDFKRAFETLDRDILLQKLWKYGIRGKE